MLLASCPPMPVLHKCRRHNARCCEMHFPRKDGQKLGGKSGSKRWKRSSTPLLSVPGLVPGSILRRWLGLRANQDPPHPRTLTSRRAFSHVSRRAELPGIPRCGGTLPPFRAGLDTAEKPSSRSPDPE